MRIISRTFPEAAFALSHLLAADSKPDMILIAADDPDTGMRGRGAYSGNRDKPLLFQIDKDPEESPHLAELKKGRPGKLQAICRREAGRPRKNR